VIQKKEVTILLYIIIMIAREIESQYHKDCIINAYL